MSELLNCPFCGSGADYVGGEGDGYIVECTKCRAKAGWGEYGYQAAAKWNTRPAPSEAEVLACAMRILAADRRDVDRVDSYWDWLMPAGRENYLRMARAALGVGE